MTAPADETWPKSAVIQGASRGLGLGFVRALLDRGVSVHATCRDPSQAAELSELATRESALHVHRLDVTDEDTIAEAVRAIRANTPQLDLVVNASGVLHGEGLKPERRVEELEARTLLDLMHV
ncbi:MAG: SDR family NAD(P)-dependent oxidoreductase, partial [Myxococcota bacterium]